MQLHFDAEKSRGSVCSEARFFSYHSRETVDMRAPKKNFAAAELERRVEQFLPNGQIEPDLRRTFGCQSAVGYLQKFCRISAALRQDLNDDSDLVGFLVVRNEHHKRDASLFSIEHQFPKLDVAGSIPVSRSIY